MQNVAKGADSGPTEVAPGIAAIGRGPGIRRYAVSSCPPEAVVPLLRIDRLSRRSSACSTRAAVEALTDRLIPPNPDSGRQRHGLLDVQRSAARRRPRPPRWQRSAQDRLQTMDNQAKTIQTKPASANKGIAMKRIPLATLAAASVSFSAFTLTSALAQSDQQSSSLHNNLAGMKAGVGLRSEQEPLWNAFQSAVEGVFRSHTPGNQAQGAAERRVISAAGRPLYDSLDDTQKSNFASVGGSAQSKAPSMWWVCYGGNAGCDFMPAGWDSAQNP
jgi:hypothetical protein